jgi:glyceraldehyde 3-phosphate dehydrogenase
MAIRVPVPNGSITEFVVDLQEEVTESDVNAAFREAAAGELEGVLGVTDDEVVSSDIQGVSYSSYVDLESTNVVNGMTKILTWYDNEFGFSNRMLDVAVHVTEN